MSAPMGAVLSASVLISSPVLWLVREGTLTATDAIQRWVICLGLCWLAITVVGALAFPGARAATPQPAAAEQEEPDRTPADLA